MCIKLGENMEMNQNNSVLIIILSSAVFAALISSLTNVIISLINNKRLSIIEKQRKQSDIDRYRYIHLYEMLVNWNEYDTIKMPNVNYENDNEEEYMEYIRKCREYILNVFVDDKNRYEIIKPLLNEEYKKELDVLKEDGENYLLKIAYSEDIDEHSALEKEYAKITGKFSNKLKGVINQQLRDLLKVDKI